MFLPSTSFLDYRMLLLQFIFLSEYCVIVFFDILLLENNLGGNGMIRYVQKCRREFLHFTIVSFLGALSVVLMAAMINLVVETITNGTVEKLSIVAALAFVYVLMDAYLDYAVDVVNERLTQAIMVHIREDLLVSIASQSIAMIDENGRDYYVNVYVNDLEVIEKEYIQELLSMYNDVWVFVFGLVSSLVMSPVFSLVMIGLSSLPFALPYFSKKILGKAKLDLSQQSQQFLQQLTEILEGMSTIKLYQAFPFVMPRVRQKSVALAKAKVQVTHTNKFVYAISYGLRMFVNLFSWVIGGYFVIQGSISLAVFFTVKQLTQYVAYPIQGFGASYTQVVAAKSITDKVLRLIDAKQEETPTQKTTIQSIQVKNVTVAAHERTILHDVTLTLDRRKKYLLIGESGSGKSTLLKALIGAIPPVSGSITYTLADQSYSHAVESIYPQIAYVGQDTALFEGSFVDNVTLFQGKSATFETAVVQAGLANWEKTADVRHASGGEKRRIDIARALYANRNVLFMDEPTAGLDAENRAQVERVVAGLDGKLVVYSTHQYDEAFVATFDSVLEVKNGTVREVMIFQKSNS